MEIKGLGEQTTVALYRQRLVADPADIYALGKDDLLQLEGFADKSAENLLASIEESRSRPLARLIYALGIRHVGEETATLLVNHFGSMHAIAAASLEVLSGIEGIGPIVAGAIHEWFQKPGNRQLIEKLRDAGLRFEGEAPREDLPLSGVEVVSPGGSTLVAQEAERMVKVPAGARLDGLAQDHLSGAGAIPDRNAEGPQSGHADHTRTSSRRCSNGRGEHRASILPEAVWAARQLWPQWEPMSRRSVMPRGWRTTSSVVDLR